jgi:hypothetical protein
MRNDSYLRALRTMLSDLSARMAVIGPKEELDQEKKDIAPDFAPFEAKFAGDNPWLRTWFEKYWQNAIAEMMWRESRGMPIEQGKG